MIKLRRCPGKGIPKNGGGRGRPEGFFRRGEQQTYAAEDWLFHESTPRQWAGLVIDGEVTIVRGLHGSTRHLAVLTPGALIAESAFLEEEAHATGAFTRNGATVWQISQAALAAFREEQPDLFYRIVARVAAGISDRLRMASERVTGAEVPGR
jgi:aspartate ammonia-lyase